MLILGFLCTYPKLDIVLWQFELIALKYIDPGR